AEDGIGRAAARLHRHLGALSAVGLRARAGGELHAAEGPEVAGEAPARLHQRVAESVQAPALQIAAGALDVLVRARDVRRADAELHGVGEAVGKAERRRAVDGAQLLVIARDLADARAAGEDARLVLVDVLQ